MLDLSAGVGLFAIPLAAGSSDVVAVETSGTAVDDATANVESARLTNVRVLRADVGEALEHGLRLEAAPPTVDASEGSDAGAGEDGARPALDDPATGRNEDDGRPSRGDLLDGDSTN